MVKLATFCKECCFYLPDRKDDSSCFRGYIKKFRDAGAEITISEDEDSAHIIHRVCPSRRVEQWLDGRSLAEANKQLNSEIYIFGSITIIVNDIESFKTTLLKLKDVKNINRFKLVIAHGSEIQSAEIKPICQDLIDFTEYTCIKAFVFEPELIINEAFKRAKNGYILILRSDKDFDINIIDKIDNIVNRRLEKLLHIEPIDDSYHQSASMAIVYKAFKGDIGFSIGEKIRHLETEQGTDKMTMTWEEVNEKYSN